MELEYTRHLEPSKYLTFEEWQRCVQAYKEGNASAVDDKCAYYVALYAVNVIQRDIDATILELGDTEEFRDYLKRAKSVIEKIKQLYRSREYVKLLEFVKKLDISLPEYH
jgi:hypothetical protein